DNPNWNPTSTTVALRNALSLNAASDCTAKNGAKRRLPSRRNWLMRLPSWRQAYQAAGAYVRAPSAGEKGWISRSALRGAPRNDEISESRLPRQCPMPDVAPVKRAIEMEAFNGAVRALTRLREIIAQRAHAQHAAASRNHVAIVIEFRSGLEHLCVHSEIGIQPRNHVATFHLAGITVRRDHHAERRARIPFRLGAIKTAVQRGLDQRREIRLQALHDRLRLGITEAHV